MCAPQKVCAPQKGGGEKRKKERVSALNEKDKSGEKRSVIRPTETDIARDCNDSGQRQWTTTVDNDVTKDY